MPFQLGLIGSFFPLSALRASADALAFGSRDGNGHLFCFPRHPFFRIAVHNATDFRPIRLSVFSSHKSKRDAIREELGFSQRLDDFLGDYHGEVGLDLRLLQHGDDKSECLASFGRGIFRFTVRRGVRSGK